jgi:hypothetical protein
MIIAPTFTANFDANFGANAPAAKAAWIAAAGVFTANFTDPIHVNITVDAVAGTSVFGESSCPLLQITYANLLAAVIADAKSPNDAIAIGPGGSMVAVDPTGGNGGWWLTKALAVIPDDLTDDGTTTFGAGNSFTFSGPIAAGTSDFQGVAAHEISEILGRQDSRAKRWATWPTRTLFWTTSPTRVPGRSRWWEGREQVFQLTMEQRC